MNKKYDNRILLGILVALAAIYFLTDIFRDSKRRKGNLRTELVYFDQNTIDNFSLFPKAEGGKEIQFSKQNNLWQLSMDGKNLEADQGVINRLLMDLRAIKPKQLVARKADQWSKYELTDSLASRVILRSGDNEPALDLYVGRVKYQMPPGGFNPNMGGQGLSGQTFVRLEGEEEVYTTEGFLAMTVNQGVDGWRKTDFIQLDRADLQQMAFSYPEDSFTLSKVDSIWQVDGQLADAPSVDRYLNLFIRRNERNFIKDFQGSSSPDYQVVFSGTSKPALTIQAWNGDAENPFYLHSSLNPGAYFRSDSTGIFSDLFVTKARFLGEE